MKELEEMNSKIIDLPIDAPVDQDWPRSEAKGKINGKMLIVSK